MRILLTAIGSMSAECAIKQLKEQGHFVVGCDIYPKEWHYETKLCDLFYQAPYATNELDYVSFLIKVCKDNNLKLIIPLTDLEIDVINKYRSLFDNNDLVLCMQTDQVLKIVRDKYRLHKEFENDVRVPSIRTCIATDIPDDFLFPCIAKPYNGRSSEGLLRNASKVQIAAIADKASYIVQEQMTGIVFTVDYVRCSKYNKDASVSRQELLRTKNGAGLTIKTSCDLELLNLVSYIGNKLDVNGCVNMEFIYNNGMYYLIDINPRFSAGVAFSVISGYDMITNHLRCFIGETIDIPVVVEENIIIKKYTEIKY